MSFAKNFPRSIHGTKTRLGAALRGGRQVSERPVGDKHKYQICLPRD